MLYDSIENFINNVPKNTPKAAELLPLLRAVQSHTFEEIRKMDFSPLDLRFGEYETKPSVEIPFEAHKKYWDLQIVLSGEENIGCAPLEDLTETEPYDEENDISFYSGCGQTLRLDGKKAILLAPWDGHQPGVAIAEPVHVKKIVVKLEW